VEVVGEDPGYSGPSLAPELGGLSAKGFLPTAFQAFDIFIFYRETRFGAFLSSFLPSFLLSYLSPSLPSFLPPSLPPSLLLSFLFCFLFFETGCQYIAQASLELAM
jgi:hypothetical protein